MESKHRHKQSHIRNWRGDQSPHLTQKLELRLHACAPSFQKYRVSMTVSDQNCHLMVVWTFVHVLRLQPREHPMLAFRGE
jgi:hypothetical protein